MRGTLKDLSPRGRRKLFRWTFFGTVGCILFAQAANWLMFREIGQPALGRAIFSGTIIPILLAGPLFFYLTLKLRELAIANHKLVDAATIDYLTRCLNRGAFTAYVEASLAAARASEDNSSGGALLVIDADQFKRINDRFGHGSGDEALRLVATAIRGAVGEKSVVGRLGGEEFAVFIDGHCDALPIAQRVCKAVESVRFTPQGTPWPLTVSVGGMSFAEPAPFSEIYRVADEMLYEAKRSGRNKVAMAPPETLINPAMSSVRDQTATAA
ncbi:GGDEF domain-containing protein [Aquibium carbonis]|uniref:diguanylate cyclase n=1 Tax=Aquibium carbonis TaxID=2495581 RepID=A0A429YWG4_9HYPH|nr:GGDEF domain-containing protein [Aquibium carbonis]RST85808.1 GGDEF domain-containing protein [Aquibium carbonis]